jgi:hypothetical protein
MTKIALLPDLMSLNDGLPAMTELRIYDALWYDSWAVWGPSLHLSRNRSFA